jgi:hypothetical protein
MQRRPFRLALGAAIVLCSLAVLAVLLYRNWPTLTAHRWKIDYARLGLTLLLNLCAYLIAIAGWHSIVARLAGANDLRLNARIYCYGAAAGRLPGVAWDIATRVVLYGNAGVSRAMVGLGSVLELILIALSGVILYLFLMPFTLSDGMRPGLWPLLGALTAGIVLTHPRTVTFVVRRVRRDALPVSLRYQDTLTWLFIYVWTWVASGLTLYATIGSISALSAGHVLQVLADWTLVGVLTSFITFVPSTLGLKEVSLTLLLSRYIPEYVVVVAVILMRVLTIGYSVLWTLCVTRLTGPAGADGRRGSA